MDQGFQVDSSLGDSGGLWGTYSFESGDTAKTRGKVCQVARRAQHIAVERAMGCACATRSDSIVARDAAPVEG